MVVGVPLVVGEVPVSGVGVFGDGGAGGLLVVDDFACRVGGDEGLDGEVVDGARVAARCGVDERDGVIAVEGIGTAGFTELRNDHGFKGADRCPDAWCRVLTSS